MKFVATLLTRLPYFFPLSTAGWLVWIGLGGLLIYSLLNWRSYQSKRSSRGFWILSALAVLTPVTALILGLEYSSGTPGSTAMLFSALPWTLAGGMFGPMAGAALGMLSGLLRGMWDSHSLFTILEFGFMGTIFAVSTRQNYRTVFFRLLRQPLFQVVVLSIIHALMFIIGAFFASTADTTTS